MRELHRGQAGSQLWTKVEAARVKCARNAPSSCQPASSLSVGWEGWLGMQCYIHLWGPRSADLTLPEELGPYLCKWLPRSGVGLIPPPARSFIPRDTPPLTSRTPRLFFSSQGLFLLPEPGIYTIGYFLTLNPNIWRLFVSKQTGKIRSKGPTLCAISSKWTEECL